MVNINFCYIVVYVPKCVYVLFSKNAIVLKGYCTDTSEGQYAPISVKKTLNIKP